MLTHVNPCLYSALKECLHNSVYICLVHASYNNTQKDLLKHKLTWIANSMHPYNLRCTPVVVCRAITFRATAQLMHADTVHVLRTMIGFKAGVS